MHKREELNKIISLFSESNLIFISYGEEENGEFRPHTKGLRIEPSVPKLEEVITQTPTLPNDFGIMPFNWKARSEEDLTRLLLERKLSRWSEEELFAYGYLLMDRVLVDIDYEGGITKERAIELAGTFRKKGIGKVAWTGGGLLAVIELDGKIEVRDRETWKKIKELLEEGIKKVIPEFDTQSLNAGKGVRLIGTFSRKRGVLTEWIIWEEGRKFDLCEMVFGVSREVLSKAPKELKDRIRERFGIELKGGEVKKATPEEVFEVVSKFYHYLDGKRNDFMLALSGEMLSCGVEKEKVEELYYEHLSHLEKNDKPRHRVMQTIDWVYKHGKAYGFKVKEWKGILPKDFFAVLKAFRGEELSLSWKDFAELVSPERLLELLRLSGEEVFGDEREVFHLESGLLKARLMCVREKVEEGEEGKKEKVKKKEEGEVFVFLDLPPCMKKALLEYKEIKNGETEWYLENLLAVSFLLPKESYQAFEEVEILESPFARAIVLMTIAKGIKRSEIGVERIGRKTLGKHDAVWNLVRCLNPLLKSFCEESCEVFKFRRSLPEVLERKVDKKSGDVVEAKIKVEGEEYKIDGKVLKNLKNFTSFLEKRGKILPRISVEWLYQGIMVSAKVEFVDTEREDFRDQLSEVLGEYADKYVDRFDGENVWIKGKKFMELLKLVGVGADKRNVKKLRDKYQFVAKHTKEGNYTLIPLSFLHEDDRDTIIHKLLKTVEDCLFVEGIRAEPKEEITEEDLRDEDFVLGRKAYISIAKGGILISFGGEKEVFQEPSGVRKWIREAKEILSLRE